MEDIGPIGLLKTIGDGRVMDDFHEQLSMLLMAVRMAHKKGHVTLKVVVSPTKDAEIPRVSIWGDVTSKIPHIERTSEFFYVDGVTHDATARQMTLSLTRKNKQ